MLSSQGSLSAGPINIDATVSEACTRRWPLCQPQIFFSLVAIRMRNKRSTQRIRLKQVGIGKERFGGGPHQPLLWQRLQISPLSRLGTDLTLLLLTMPVR